jgi:hypothetical protein
MYGFTWSKQDSQLCLDQVKPYMLLTILFRPSKTLHVIDYPV